MSPAPNGQNGVNIAVLADRLERIEKALEKLQCTIEDNEAAQQAFRMEYERRHATLSEKISDVDRRLTQMEKISGMLFALFAVPVILGALGLIWQMVVNKP